jgi:uncharacterized protein YtpQ (UPF0354 family)
MSSEPLPWLTEALTDKGGALVPAAQAFLRGHLGARAREFRGGRSGIVFLCEVILHFVSPDEASAHSGDHASEEAEHRFIEGAGALLGLLLIDHVGDGAHVARGSTHRVRLGPYGFFDPFAAIDRVLDAPSPKQELMRQIGLAEAEGAGTGAIARVVTQLLTQLRRERPDLQLVDHFDLTLKLASSEQSEPLEIDLRRAVESTRDQDARAVGHVTQRILSMLPGATDTRIALDEARERLMPRLVRSEALRDLSASGKSLLAGTPLTADLSVALLLEYEGRARYVREGDLSAWQIPFEQAFEIAWRNLAARSKASRIAREDTPHGTLFVARTGDGRDSARVVLPALPSELRTRIGARVALALPHRDTFLACDADNPQLVALLRARALEDAARAPHRLSDCVFLYDERGLRPLDP